MEWRILSTASIRHAANTLQDHFFYLLSDLDQRGNKVVGSRTQHNAQSRNRNLTSVCTAQSLPYDSEY